MERDWKSLNAQLNLELKSQDDELLWDFAALTPLCSASDTLYIMLSQTRAPRGFPAEQFTNHRLPLWASEAASVKNKLLRDLLP